MYVPCLISAQLNTTDFEIETDFSLLISTVISLKYFKISQDLEIMYQSSLVK